MLIFYKMTFVLNELKVFLIKTKARLIKIYDFSSVFKGFLNKNNEKLMFFL